MILSVSRRTDIPSFYSEWFFNRIREGHVLVRNPMNYNQVSRVSLDPNLIDCIVFWTKDPLNMLMRLDELQDYKYYFQITITPYDNRMEGNIRNKEDIIDSFKLLSRKIGKEKLIWRYDPIILSDDITIDYHLEQFEKYAEKLSGYTDLCIISFLDLYRNTEINMKSIGPSVIRKEDMLFIGEELSKIARIHNMRIETCSEDIDLSSIGIEHSKCIDDDLVSRIVGQKLDIRKDKNQREICGCVSSIDIGAYNTCKHGCLYCYANFNTATVITNARKHNKDSPFLCGDLEENDKITDRKMKLYKQKYIQGTFL